MSEKKKLPERADVVIVGGGIIGCALAYHLAKLGVGDVLLLERRQLTCGTTWHAAGLVGQMRGSRQLSESIRYGVHMFEEVLPEETGVATGFRPSGSLHIASNANRMESLQRLSSINHGYGLESETLSPDAVKDRFPYLTTDDLVGAVFVPSDGQADPVGITQALASGARAKGAKILEGVKVDRIIVDGGAARGVETSAGTVEAGAVAICGGMWSHELAAAAGACVPLHACEHFYILTEPVADLPAGMPTIRDMCAYAYYKEDAGKILLGCFEPNAKPWGMKGIPEDFCFDTLPDDFDHFAPILEDAVRRMPLLETAGIQTFFCGPESFTPDTQYLVGETPEVKRLFVAAGLNSVGIQSAPGIGRDLAQWIRDGSTTIDFGSSDIRRVAPFQRSRAYLVDRVAESLGDLYAIPWPYKQKKTARGIRVSPMHEDLKEAGACFGEVAGWERANWFAREGQKPEYEYSFDRQNWFENCAAECRAARDDVTLMDLTSFAKFLVTGAGAGDALDQICANRIQGDVGRVIYTQWLNHSGGIEADVTVTRMAEDSFLVISGAGTQTRDMAWLRRYMPQERCCAVDVTSAWSIIGVIGPKAQALLRAVSPDDFSEAGFPYGSSRDIEIGMTIARASRLGFVGEAGWELLVPTEQARHVYRTLAAAGGTPAGLHAIDSMRLEKARRHFGDDITSEENPIEAGLSFAVAWDKPGGFIGREALLRRREEDPPRRRMVQVVLDDPEGPLFYREEPVLRDGEAVGAVTSAGYGHRVGKVLGMAYVAVEPGKPIAEQLKGGEWSVNIAGGTHKASVSLRPVYDPGNEKLKLES